MSDRQYNNYDMMQKVINTKGKYRNEEEPHKKNTYNFITDPRLRRGHNFGVVYVSNTEDETNSKIRDQQRKNEQRQERFRKKKEEELKKESQEAIYMDQKYRDFGIATERVVNKEKPKPITFEVEVQVDTMGEKEIEKYIWPEYTGIEKETEIGDTDLFNFDREVQPLVQVIVSKTIEDSRREVLEEEEREEIQKTMLKYQQYNQQDEQRIKQIEEQEQQRYQERKKNTENKIKRVQMAKIFQKKLLSRTLSKNYLSQLFNNSMNILGKRGKFKNPEVDDYFTVILPEIIEIAQKEKEDDYKYSNGFIEMMKNAIKLRNIEKHRTAIQKEKQRKEKERQDYLLKKKLEAEEKERQKEERRRRRHERKLNELKKEIQEELMVNSEWVEEYPENIYNINGYYQKAKCVTCLGGPICQLIIAINELNKVFPQCVSDDKVSKILDAYLPKSHTFNFVYKADDLEEFKTMADDINAIEDIKNVPKNKFNTIVAKMYDNHLIYDDMLPFIFEVAKDVMDYKNFEKLYKKIYTTLLKKYREDADFDSVKFVTIDSSTDEIPLHSIVIVNAEIEKINNPNEGAPEIKAAGTNVEFEPFLSEKTLIFPTISDKIKVIAINKNFDRIFRDNIYELINRMYGIDGDKEEYLPIIDAEYDKLVNALLIKLTEKYQKEAFEMIIKLPKEEEDEEGEEKEEGKEDNKE